MTDPIDDYVLIDSSLSGEFVRDGIRVEVQIYRGEDDTSWVLEVIDSANNSYVWDDQFATDQLAMDAFLSSVEAGGMTQYNPHYKSKLH